MKKIGIVLDAWKYPFFKTALDEAGYIITNEFDGPCEKCITLDIRIEAAQVADLKALVEKAQKAAANSKLN